MKNDVTRHGCHLGDRAVDLEASELLEAEPVDVEPPRPFEIAYAQPDVRDGRMKCCSHCVSPLL